MATADCVCTLISGLQVRQIYRTVAGRRDRTPLASSFPLCHYARVRYSGILIPMPLHFAITITRYSPGLRVAPDLCCLAIYISSKCFSIPSAEGLIATQMDMWTFTFYTTPVFLLPLMLFHSSRGAEHTAGCSVSNGGYRHKHIEEYLPPFITVVWLTLRQCYSPVLDLIQNNPSEHSYSLEHYYIQGHVFKLFHIISFPLQHVKSNPTDGTAASLRRHKTIICVKEWSGFG